MGAALSLPLCYRSTCMYNWFILHLYIRESKTSDHAAEFDARKVLVYFKGLKQLWGKKAVYLCWFWEKRASVAANILQ